MFGYKILECSQKPHAKMVDKKYSNFFHYLDNDFHMFWMLSDALDDCEHIELLQQREQVNFVVQCRIFQKTYMLQNSAPDSTGYKYCYTKRIINKKKAEVRSAQEMLPAPRLCARANIFLRGAAI